jgi:hypothetical protein
VWDNPAEQATAAAGNLDLTVVSILFYLQMKGTDEEKLPPRGLVKF